MLSAMQRPLLPPGKLKAAAKIQALSLTAMQKWCTACLWNGSAAACQLGTRPFLTLPALDEAMAPGVWV